MPPNSFYDLAWPEIQRLMRGHNRNVTIEDEEKEKMKQTAQRNVDKATRAAEHSLQEKDMDAVKERFNKFQKEKIGN